MKNFWLFGICALALASAAAVADVGVERTYRIDLVLAADGSVQQLQAAPNVPEAIARILDDRVSRWQFEPGAVDGEPAVTETSVMVRMRATTDPADPDSALLEVVDATVGVAKLATVPPRYPASAARANREGMVVMAVDIDGEGSVSDARLYEHAPPVDRRFQRAALDAVARWTFKPERVAGRGVPTTIVVPVCFTLHRPTRGGGLDSSPSGNCRYSLTGDNKSPLHSGAVTLQPVARLLVDPRV